MSLRCQIGLLVFATALIPETIEGMRLFGNPKEYSVVIDVGSYTTNLMVSVMENQSGLLRLAEEELYQKFSGISRYSSNPQAIKDYLEHIINVAEEYIPKDKWSDTQITFRATAGFHQLGDRKQNQILNEARNVLLASHFKSENDFVSVLSKSDEGMYSWVAINLILDRFHSNPENMVATVGLDEDSSQITFPLTPEFVQKFAFEKSWIPVSGQHVNFYTNSDERLGLGPASVAILQMDIVNGNDHITNSPCVSYLDNGKDFYYNRNMYLIQKELGYTGDFLACKNKIYDYLRLLNLRSFDPLPNYKLYVTHGFIDVLQNAGVVDTINGGITTGDDIRRAGINVCNERIARKNNPVLCLQLTYIYVLLSEGYKIPVSNNIYVRIKANGHRINWATGLAYYNQELKHAQ